MTERQAAGPAPGLRLGLGERFTPGRADGEGAAKIHRGAAKGFL
ncbi:hypothetical protein ACIPSJ_37785 [Streptomyces sp. NPDC090088]